MKLRQAKKIARSALCKDYRGHTLRRAYLTLNKFAPVWEQPIRIQGVLCSCWGEAIYILCKTKEKEL